MKILIVNESVVAGGAEIQAAREKAYFTGKGHIVALLTFDSQYPLQLERTPDNCYNIPINFNNLQKLYHRLFRSRKYSKLIKKVFDSFEPEYIHINHTKHLPLDVFAIVKKYPCVQTLRDYGFICPKDTCIKQNGSICSGYKCKECLKCVEGRKAAFFKYFNMSRLNRKRCEAVDIRVAPSQALADACNKNNLETRCLNNPFDFSILHKSDASPDAKVYLYYGTVAEEKGIIQLLEVFDDFHKSNPEVSLWIAGRIADGFNSKFMQLIKGKDYIRYHGVLKNKEIMDLFKDVYCVVVPSLWIENYPNTVLESMANKTLVIGTNRGGIPELIKDDRMLFDILSHEDILSKLQYAHDLLRDEYIEIVERNFKRVLENNSQERYYEKLCAIYKTISNRRA